MALIRDYLAGARPDLVGEEGVPELFVSRTGRALEKSAVEWMVRKYARAARIRKTITPHVFRVTNATAMLRAGANVRPVQELLGHRSVATLDPYLKLTITELKVAHERFHRRERADARAADAGGTSLRRLDEIRSGTLRIGGRES